MAQKGLNKVMLIGRLGKDPEVKYTQSGAAICNFPLATSESWLDKASGERKEKTEWHNIVVFGKLAEICGKYLAKGKMIYIEGRLQTDSWEKDGQTHYKTKIVANDMRMLDSRGAGSGNQDGESEEYPSTAGPSPSGGSGGEEDDIPF